MSSSDTCSECGTAIPADSPGGFCGHCLLGLGLGPMQNAECRVQNEEGRQKEVRSAECRVQNEERRQMEVGSAECGVRNEEGKLEQPKSTQVTVPLSERPGDWIGRYQLLEEI